MKDKVPQTKTGETTIDVFGAQRYPVDSHVPFHDISPVSNQCSSRIDLQALAGEIKRLRLEMDRTQGKDCWAYKTLINLAFAEREAKAGQATNVVEHLKKAGKGALAVATKMGLTMITESVARPLEK